MSSNPPGIDDRAKATPPRRGPDRAGHDGFGEVREVPSLGRAGASLVVHDPLDRPFSRRDFLTLLACVETEQEKNANWTQQDPLKVLLHAAVRARIYWENNP